MPHPYYRSFPWLCGLLALPVPAAGAQSASVADINARFPLPTAEAVDLRSGKTVSYQILGELALAGDIILGKHADLQQTGIPPLTIAPASADVEEQKSRRKRAAPFLGARLWPNNSVYYSLQRANDATRRAFYAAIATIESASSVRFFERGSRADYIDVISGPGPCRSVIGRRGGAQDLVIDRECEQPGPVMHEVMHALGFGHEHARPDRDQHIDVSQSPYASSMRIDYRTSVQWPYDVGSIMHYNLPGVRSIDPSQKITDLETLSAGDRTALNALYPGHPPSGTDPRPEDAPAAVSPPAQAPSTPPPVEPPPPEERPRHTRTAVQAATLSARSLDIDQDGVGHITLYGGSRPLNGMGISLRGTRQFDVTIQVRDGNERHLVFKPHRGFSGNGHFELALNFTDGSSETLALPIRVEARSTRQDEPRQLVARTNGLCVEAKAGGQGSLPETHTLTLQSCRPVAEQRWEHNASGEIRSAAFAQLCLGMQSSRRGEKTLQPCRHDATQMWQYTDQLQLVNAAENVLSLRHDSRGTVFADVTRPGTTSSHQWDWR